MATTMQEAQKAGSETSSPKTGRIIGIRHRVKQTAGGEARPTQIFITSATGKPMSYELEDDRAELDFVLGCFPVKFRDVLLEDTLEGVQPHHIKWRKLNEGEDQESFSQRHIKREGKQWFVAHKIPVIFDGLRQGDKVAMVLGGSGDRFAFALANRGASIGATVHRIPTFVLKDKRSQRDAGKTVEKDRDAELLTEVFGNSPEHFYEVRSRDRALIRVRECLRARTDAMKARMACEQRLRQAFIGRIFLNEAGHYPEGSIEARFDEFKASDAILAAILQEEKMAEKALTSACEALDVYKQLFEPIEGVGPMIAARIISAVNDVRMFETPAKLKAFMGAHVLKDGRFPRRRGGEVANWNPDTRQALFLLADQFNRRPGSKWGQKLLYYKEKFREIHPEETVDGKKRYTKGHTLKMAQWRTATKFVEWLWREWWKLEGGQQALSKAA